MFRRVVLSIVLVLFASITVGVILGLDDAARGSLAGRFAGVSATSASPESVPPSPSVRATAKAKPTPRPTPTVRTTPPASPRPTAKPTQKATTPPKATTSPKPVTPKPSVRPSDAPTSKPPSAKPGSGKYLKGPLKKGKGGTVYLTFDDGPGVATPTILAILTRTGSTATFFHLGVNEPYFPHADARIRAQGSKVANHSYDHPDLTTRTPAQLTWQIKHGPKAKCFRPPYGATNSAVRTAIAHAGMRQVLWDVDTLDWTKPGVATLAKTGRLKSITNGSIVLMHDAGGDRSQTVAALPTIIADLHARGYQVRALPSC